MRTKASTAKRFPPGERRYWAPSSKASVNCRVCWHMYLKADKTNGQKVFDLNWDRERASCQSCAGTQREAIPFSEIFKIGRKGDFL